MLKLVNVSENAQTRILQQVFNLVQRDIPRHQPTSHHPSVLGCKIFPSSRFLRPEAFDQGQRCLADRTCHVIKCNPTLDFNQTHSIHGVASSKFFTDLFSIGTFQILFPNIPVSQKVSVRKTMHAAFLYVGMFILIVEVTSPANPSNGREGNAKDQFCWQWIAGFSRT